MIGNTSRWILGFLILFGFFFGAQPPSRAQSNRLGSPAFPAANGPLPIVIPASGPKFFLSHPASGRTDLPTEGFKLSWTPAPWAKSFLLEVSEDKTFSRGGDVISATVTGATSYTVPKDKLKDGNRYYWRITGECDPAKASCAAGTQVLASNAPFYFITIRQLGFFNYLSKKHFSLQRVVTGDDETEGANFSFLHTFNKKTVYTTDFAFIWDSPERGGSRARYQIETSVEGHLTSAESDAEDALTFAAGGRVLTPFGSTERVGLHSTFSAKLEGDQQFDTKKAYFEALETHTALSAYIGQFSGDPKDAVQFRWRPFFGLQLGRTYKRGQAALPEDTVLRLIPRVRLELKLNRISQALKMQRTFLFLDNTFYYLPIERSSKSRNFFASGLEFDFTPNFGLSFNYKSGTPAPKFQRVNTFGGALTIRFGKNAD